MKKIEVFEMYMDYLKEVKNYNNKKDFYEENHKSDFMDFARNYVNIDDEEDKKYLIKIAEYILNETPHEKLNINFFSGLKYEDNKRFWSENSLNINIKPENLYKLMFDSYSNYEFYPTNIVSYNMSEYSGESLKIIVNNNLEDLTREQVLSIFTIRSINDIGNEVLKKKISKKQDLFNNFHDLFYIFNETYFFDSKIDHVFKNIDMANINILKNKSLLFKNENNETVFNALLKTRKNESILKVVIKNKEIFIPDDHIDSFKYLLNKKGSISEIEVEFLSLYLPKLSKESLAELSINGRSLVLDLLLDSKNGINFLKLKDKQGHLFNYASVKNKNKLKLNKDLKFNFTVLVALSLSNYENNEIKFKYLENFKNSLNKKTKIGIDLNQDFTLLTDHIKEQLTENIFANKKTEEKKHNKRLRL